MTRDDDKLIRLVDELRKAVIRTELHRHAACPRPVRAAPPARPRAA